MKLGRAAASLAPWAGLWAGAGAWMLHHQIGTNAVYSRCDASDPVIIAALGIAAAAAAAGGAALSWSSRRRPSSKEESADTRRLVSTLGTGSGALFAFAIALQTMASFLEPPCG